MTALEYHKQEKDHSNVCIAQGGFPAIAIIYRVLAAPLRYYRGPKPLILGTGTELVPRYGRPEACRVAPGRRIFGRRADKLIAQLSHARDT